MLWRVDTQPWHDVEVDWLVVCVPQADQLPAQVAAVDGRLGGLVARLKQREDLTGKVAELVPVLEPPSVAACRLLLVGLGKPEELSVGVLNRALQAAARSMSTKKDRTVAVLLPDLQAQGISVATAAEVTATALVVGCVGQGLWKSEPDRFPFREVRVLTDDAHSGEVGPAVERGVVLGEAINLVRELVNRPASEVYPETFAVRASQLADELGLRCDVLDEQRLREERMNALLAVASGSQRPPRLVVVEYRGASDDAPLLALVGKGVTFDSGGLSIKSSDSMSTMKSDMAGAATVLGAVTAMARLKLPVNVRGYMGMVENLPSGSSYKVGDVLTARNGVTIEVLNTDAEGRLVLADVLSYAVDQGADRLLDLATLTGACVVALGEQVAGVFTNDQPWCDVVLQAARACGEDVWQLPMFDHYAEQIKSEVADVKNVGGRWGGAITAAKFLEKFVGGKPWVHVDIAGPAFASNSKGHREGGATGCLLRTVVETARRLAQTPPATGSAQH